MKFTLVSYNITFHLLSRGYGLLCPFCNTWFQSSMLNLNLGNFRNVFLFSPSTLMTFAKKCCFNTHNRAQKFATLFILDGEMLCGHIPWAILLGPLVICKVKSLLSICVKACPPLKLDKSMFSLLVFPHLFYAPFLWLFML